MGRFNNLNPKKNTNIGITMSDSCEWTNLRALAEDGYEEIVIHGFLIKDGDLGKSVAVVVDKDTFCWLPDRAVAWFEALDGDAIQDIMEGKLKFTNIHTVEVTKGPGKGKTTVVWDYADNE